ncbi:MAG: hypothetical protein PW789_10540 [Edaphobacter sp.]|uniref:hypothetical protein n=1 Tax=Edaphobacter sp. TaxID=1934404 RepID=UPI00238FA04A|nr:hypothetical protein [Edaphobacter sp.]MDE1177028.1 hypothetical protein [Edaphobacter sp.]
MITTIVGFAISMAFLFLMLSAACSAIQEIVANLLRWRARTLEKGLDGLLLNEGFRKAVYETPLIKGLYAPAKFRKELQPPAYIPSTTLALAILQVARDKGLKLDGAGGTAEFRETEKLLSSLLHDCPEPARQRERIEKWFNDSMDRVSGWYKRKSHAWIWVFGIVLSLLLNADAITLSKRFWNDQALRDAVVAEATDYVKASPKTEEALAAPAGAHALQQDAQKDGDTEELQESIRRMNLLREHLPGVPLGWCFLHREQDASASLDVRVGEHKASCWPDLIHPTTGVVEVSLAGTDPRLVDLGDGTWWIWKILGLLATALAISQGAPFWFDLLQKAVNLRLAGTPPATTSQKN